MQFPLISVLASSPGRSPWSLAEHRERRSGSGLPRCVPLHGTDAPSLETRWVVLVEDGRVVTPPCPCLFDESLAELEAASAMEGARPGVTARVGTMRRLLSLPLGLRAEDFRPRPCAGEDAG